MARKVDMLHGPLFGKIVAFSLPLAASSILQQLFNSADTAVVGRFDSSQAMAAVGSNASVINLILSLFIGLSVGANVVVASLIGKREMRRIEDAVHTIIAVALISGVLLLFVGIAVSRPVLELIGTPENVIELAVLYLRIYSLGMPFIMLYNFSSAILRSMGDSKRPFFALVIAGLVNVALNLVLVIVFHLGVAGVAIATVTSNVVSSSMMLRDLIKEKEPFHLDLKRLRVRKEDLLWMIRIGAPAGLQGMVFSFSNTVIQVGINGFGSNAIAGSAAALNFEYICYFSINAFNQASVTFTSQNFAAGAYDRCRSVYRITLFMGAVSCAALDLFFVSTGNIWLGLFSTSAKVLGYAKQRFAHVLLWQWFAAGYEVSGSTMRGMGHSLSPALLTVFGTCLFRIVWVYLVLPSFRTFAALMNVYPASWVLTDALVIAAYFLVRKKAFAPSEKRA